MSQFKTISGLLMPTHLCSSLSTGRRTAQQLLRLMAILLVFCSLRLAAQVATGDILGTVTDPAGAVIPGATVRLENIGTHEVRTFTTKGDGGYTISAIQPGTYTVTIGSPSFKTFDTKNVVVSAADRVRIDAALQPGSVDERVEVTSTPTSLQTDSTTVGSTITEKTLLDAPLNGRNYIGLVQVQAGVNAGSPNSLSSGSNIVDRRHRLQSQRMAKKNSSITINWTVSITIAEPSERFFSAPRSRQSAKSEPILTCTRRRSDVQAGPPSTSSAVWRQPISRFCL